MSDNSAPVVKRAVVKWGVIAAVLVGLIVAAFVCLGPSTEVKKEEAEIFATDDAQWFGADPVRGRAITFYGIREQDGRHEAVLEVDGRRVVAVEGDTLIPPCVSLYKMYSAAVLLDICGAFGLLSPYGEGGALDSAVVKELSLGRGEGVPVVGVQDLRGDPAVTRLVREYHQRLFDAPLSLRGQIEIKMNKQSSGERRYFIFPGDDPRVFDTLPLHHGDRIHAVNGVALSEAEALSDLYTRLGETRQLAVTLEKDGRYRVVLMSL